jgi:hypothetical protein
MKGSGAARGAVWVCSTPASAIAYDLLEHFGRRCDPNLGCGRPLSPGDAWTCDHIQAVINGGPNRERNLHPLCEWCEPPKTEADVHEKSRSYRKRLRHAGIKLAPKGRPLPGTFASGWKHRMDGGWEWRATKRPPAVGRLPVMDPTNF